MKYYITKADEMVGPLEMDKPGLCLLGVYPCTYAGRKKCDCHEWKTHLASLPPVKHRLPNKVGDIVEEGKDFEWKYQIEQISSNIDVWRTCSRREYENSLKSCRRKVAIPKGEKPNT